MGTEPTKDELAIFDEIGRLAESIWDVSRTFSAPFTDPKMMSVLLYKRLRTNHIGFTALWNQPLPLEAAMILRSGLEAAICIAANLRMQADFVALVRADAAATLTGQIKMQRADDATNLVRDSEANLRMLTDGLPEGIKPARLVWQSLAEVGNVPRLYGCHRMLSGISSHVTGLSLMQGISDDSEEMDASQERLRNLNKRMHPIMMASATLTGSLHHAELLGDEKHYVAAVDLTKRMDELSEEWPGAKK